MDKPQKISLPQKLEEEASFEEYSEFQIRWRRERTKNMAVITGVVGIIAMIIALFWIGMHYAPEANKSEVITMGSAATIAFISLYPDILRKFYNTNTESENNP